MRDIALLLLFVGVIPLALRYTWVGVMLWTWFSFMNPHRLTSGFAATAPFAQITAIATLISVFLDRKNLRFPRDATVVSLILLLLWMCITTLAAIYPEQSFDRLITIFKIQLMTIIAFAALRERKQIEIFIWVIVASLGFYGVKGGIFTLLSGGSARVWGPPSSYIEGNNELGLALTMTIPLMHFLRQVSPRRWLRHGLLVMMLLSAAAVLGTQSRGALLAISAMALVLWFRSKTKIVGAASLIVLTVLFLSFMPSSWETRMQTIGSYQQDHSAMSRIIAWRTAVAIANDRITGGGLLVATRAVFQKYSEDPDWVITAHSIYFQVLGEHGYIGLLLFLFVGATTLWSTVQLRKAGRDRPETLWLYELGGMIQVSMAGYAVGGAFLSLAYFDLPYSIAVVVVASKYWLREERWRTETKGLFDSGAPLGLNIVNRQHA